MLIKVINRICPHEKCKRYGPEKDDEGNPTKRSCYYGPGCFRGDVVVMIELTQFVIDEIKRKVKNQ